MSDSNRFSVICDRQLALFLAIAACFVAAKLFLIIRYPLQIHHDCALLLQQGQLILDGWVPYVSFIEVNPPLIMYLNVLPAFLARSLGLNALPTFSFLVLILAVWSATSIYKSLRLLDRKNDTQSAVVVFATYLGITLLVVGNEFGQREHLFSALCFPFIFLRLLRWSGEYVPAYRGAVLGVLAAIGVCLKPYFLLIVAGPEIYWFFSYRRFRPLLSTEFWCFVATGLAYVGHFYFLPAEMFRAYFFVWVPEVAKHYDAYANGIRHTLVQLYFLVPIVVAVAAILLSRCYTRGVRRWILGLACATLAAAITYMIQLKGWKYHAVPMEIGAALLVALLGSASSKANGSLTDTKRASWTIPRLYTTFSRSSLAILLMFCAYRAYSMDRLLHDRCVPTELYTVVDKMTQTGDTVLFIDTSVVPAYPMMMQLGLLPASRYLQSLPVALAYEDEKHDDGRKLPYHSASEMSNLEAAFLRDMFADIQTSTPILIAIKSDEHPQACPKNFRMLDYLRQYPSFKYVEEHYDAIEEIDGFRLFVRK